MSFYIDKETLKANGADSYYFVDFGVSKDNCEKDCVMWEIVEKDNSFEVSEKILKQPLTYGQHIDYMETRIEAKTITSDKYCAAGTASLINNKKIIGGKVFQECYKIDKFR